MAYVLSNRVVALSGVVASDEWNVTTAASPPTPDAVASSTSELVHITGIVIADFETLPIAAVAEPPLLPACAAVAHASSPCPSRAAPSLGEAGDPDIGSAVAVVTKMTAQSSADAAAWGCRQLHMIASADSAGQLAAVEARAPQAIVSALRRHVGRSEVVEWNGAAARSEVLRFFTLRVRRPRSFQARR